MTIITKSTLKNKPEVMKIPLVLENNEVGVETAAAPHQETNRSSGALFCLVILALLVASAGVVTGLSLYHEYMRSDVTIRYQGSCSIPIDYHNSQLIEPNYKEQQRWASPSDIENATFDTEDYDEVPKSLDEQFEIGDTFEKIVVLNGPNRRPTSFIHDFSTNMTGIIDAERCFVMSLDRSIVLPPSELVLGLEGRPGAEAGEAREERAMRALLPALLQLVAQAPLIAEACRDRPAYRLVPDTRSIRKRSTGGEGAVFTSWAGRGVAHIHVPNVAALRRYEERR